MIAKWNSRQRLSAAGGQRTCIIL